MGMTEAMLRIEITKILVMLTADLGPDGISPGVAIRAIQEIREMLR